LTNPKVEIQNAGKEFFFECMDNEKLVATVIAGVVTESKTYKAIDECLASCISVGVNNIKKVASFLIQDLSQRKIDPSTVETRILESDDTSTIVHTVFDICRNKTDEYIQKLFAKIMADEIENEGSFHIETVHRLAQLSQKDLLFFFNEVAPFCQNSNLHLKTLHNKTSFLDLNIVTSVLGYTPAYDVPQHTYLRTRVVFSSGHLSLLTNDVIKMNKYCKRLNRFGGELLKLQEIRKWTEDDKEALIKHCEECGIKREDITFE